MSSPTPVPEDQGVPVEYTPIVREMTRAAADFIWAKVDEERINGKPDRPTSTMRTNFLLRRPKKFTSMKG